MYVHKVHNILETQNLNPGYRISVHLHTKLLQIVLIVMKVAKKFKQIIFHVSKSTNWFIIVFTMSINRFDEEDLSIRLKITKVTNIFKFLSSNLSVQYMVNARTIVLWLETKCRPLGFDY